jgi:predicted phage baseplate assembly protein
MANEFPGEGSADPARMFTLDAQSGMITFGNGRNGLVPPMGAAVLAVGYRHVAGAAANAVAAGDKMQAISPIAGIDQVIALGAAAGGADVEDDVSARGRAPVKLANGGRIVTLGDIETYVRDRNPRVAQARAQNWRGGTRLVVVGAGARIVLPPSARKAIVRALEAVASFGVVKGLTVVGPRLLPIAVSLTAKPDPEVDFAGVQEAAAAAILALLDHQDGGFDGQGWPVGRLPCVDDIAAALAPLGDRAVIDDIAIARDAPAKPMPDPFPGDVLVRIARRNIVVGRYPGRAT